MSILSPRQSEVFNFIKRFYNRNSFSPTLREISEEFDISIPSAQGFVNTLIDKGYIQKTPNVQRSLIPKGSTVESKWINGKPTYNGYVFITVGNAFKYFFEQERQLLLQQVLDEVIKEDEKPGDEFYPGGEFEHMYFNLRNNLRAEQRELIKKLMKEV